MTPSREAQIAADFRAEFAAAQRTPQGADIRAICEKLAHIYATDWQTVDRIQQDAVTAQGAG